MILTRSWPYINHLLTYLFIREEVVIILHSGKFNNVTNLTVTEEDKKSSGENQKNSIKHKQLHLPWIWRLLPAVMCQTPPKRQIDKRSEINGQTSGIEFGACDPEWQ